MTGMTMLSVGLLAFSSAVAQSAANPDRDLTRHVNTLIGTRPWSKKIQLAGPELAQGHTYPGVGPPFAMTQWSPQTTTGGIPYRYDHDRIQGFRATHYPSGAVMHDYGAFTLMPMAGRAELDPEKRAADIDRSTEIARPHHYAVELDAGKIRAELTATSRAGLFNFTYSEDAPSFLVLDFPNARGGFIRIDPSKREVIGFSADPGTGTPPNFACYFVLQLDAPIDEFKLETAEDHGRDAAWLKISPIESKLSVKAGASFISIRQARENLNREIPGWDFQAVRSRTKEAWNAELNKIQLTGGTKKQRTIFYTALYHCLLLPREFSEDGRYFSPFDGRVHNGVSYTDFSLWDTFRAEHPLLILLTPNRVSEMITSLIQSYDEGGWLPKWPNPGYSNVMMGTHADSVIADAYLKGVRGFDVEKAYEAMLKNATIKGDKKYAARVGIEDYNRQGFVAGDKHGECIARTMEFAYDDFCIAQLAKALGKKDDHETFLDRSRNYRNVLDPQTRLVRGRRSNSAWMDPNDWSISVWAGESAQSLEIYRRNHTLFVPHDVQGLIDFLGGDDRLCESLDTLFATDQYYVGDEFSMHAPFLYNYAGQPWKTQRTVRDMLSFYFDDGPDGLCGNDDCGQVSAWYIFSALGFYPVAPGFPSYALTAPVFDEAILKLPNGRQFIVRTKYNSPNNQYIQTATLNGEPHQKCFIMHDDILRGGTLEFELGPQPNKDWAIDPSARPFNPMPRDKYIHPPFLTEGDTSFRESTRVAIATHSDSGAIHYTLSDSTPNAQSPRYERPFTVSETTTIKAVTIENNNASAISTFHLIELPKDRLVVEYTRPSDKYSGHGSTGLVDYQTGGTFFRSLDWMGYEGIDFEATVDLGSQQPIHELGLGALQDAHNWIFLPENVRFLVSDDGTAFRPVGSVPNDVTIRRPGVPERREFSIQLENQINGRYVKVIAKNHGVCPPWHDFAGKPGWIFVDEIAIR